VLSLPFPMPNLTANLEESQRPLSVLVVDDEQPARQRITDLLAEQKNLRVLAEADDGIQAVDLIRREKPDLVLLDVQMPGLDGFEVVKEVGVDNMPVTVFVTAYSEYAIRAFEQHALDYLLKPFSDERFESMLGRVRDRLSGLRSAEFAQSLLRLMDTLQPRAPYRERIAVKNRNRTHLVAVDDIESINADGVYVSIDAGSAEFLHRASIGELLSMLDPGKFVRIHRSTIVNLRAIVHLEAVSHGDYSVVLKSGKSKRVSRMYRANIEGFLGDSL
jgi:two-component system, LytTR family, response regulator